jgi:hypothetical protein
MPISFKVNKRNIITKPILTPIEQITTQTENINLEPKSKSKSLKVSKTKEVPRINNKSKISMNIPGRRNKKIMETETEINLESDNE